MVLRCTHLVGGAQRKRCFTPAFCEAVISLQSSWPIQAEVCLSHGKTVGHMAFPRHTTEPSLLFFESSRHHVNLLTQVIPPERASQSVCQGLHYKIFIFQRLSILKSCSISETVITSVILKLMRK